MGIKTRSILQLPQYRTAVRMGRTTPNTCKIFVVFVVEHWTTTNILPTNEAILPTFTCSASSNHEKIIHEVTKYCSTTNVLPPPKITRYIRYNTYNSQCFVHLSGLRAIAETADVNGSSDVSGVNEGNVVVKIRRRLDGYKKIRYGVGPFLF